MNSTSIATAIRLPPRRRCPPRHTSGLYACPGVPLCRRDLCAACGRVRWIGFTWMPRRVDGRDSTRLSAQNPLELGHKYSQRQPRSYIGRGGTPEARMHLGPSAVANKDTGGPPSSTFDRDRTPHISVLSRRAQHRGRKRGSLHALVFASTSTNENAELRIPAAESLQLYEWTSLSVQLSRVGWQQSGSAADSSSFERLPCTVTKPVSDWVSYCACDTTYTACS